MILEELVDACRAALASDTGRSEIATIMHDLFADPAALAAEIPRFDDAEVAESARGWRLGGEHVVHRSDDLTVMVLDTLPGVLQPPHNHNMDVFIGVFEGCEEQRFWVQSADGVNPTTGRLVEAGEVMALGASAIHAISAPTHLPARAVHVYLGDIYGVERSVFDPDSLEAHPMGDERYDDFCRAVT